MLLYIDACVRENSRTRRLSDRLLKTLKEPCVQLKLAQQTFPVVDEAFLMKRDRLVAEGRFEDPVFDLARQFAQADGIVIAAPFWDLSFPAVLKTYLEHINVVGITFRYTPEGVPEGLCRAKWLYYVTTAGGDFLPEQYGYGYVEALAKRYYGIENTAMISATGFDIDGAQVEEILQKCEREITDRFSE